MKPLLFSSTRTRGQGFATPDKGVLVDALSCTVTEELNGEFTLELVYPENGMLQTGFPFNSIQLRDIIVANTAPSKSGVHLQPFRIYSIKKQSDGTMLVLAQHLSYDLNGIPVNDTLGGPNVALTLSDLCTLLPTKCAISNDFAFATDYTGSAKFQTEELMSARAVIGQAIETFGVDVEFDGWDVNFLQHRGTNGNFTILYGKNLIDLNQEENLSELYTGVYAYYQDGDGNVKLTAQVDVPGFAYDRLLAVDLSDQFDDVPSLADLQTAAQNYIDENKIGIPEVNLDVSFTQLRDMPDGRITTDSEVFVGDDVTVAFERLGIVTTARITRIVYDALSDEITEVSVGDHGTGFSGIVAESSTDSKKNKTNLKSIDKLVSKYLPMYRQQLTSGSLDSITLQGHYYVVTANVPNVSGKPSDVSSPYNVIHFNSAGSRAMQILYVNTATPSGVWWRSQTSGGVWSPWTKVANDKPVDISGQLGTVTPGTGMASCSITDAYYCHGYVTIRLGPKTSGSLASNGEMTGTISFPPEYAPKMTVNGIGFYTSHACVGRITSSGTFVIRNTSTTAIADGNTVYTTFTFPCG